MFYDVTGDGDYVKALSDNGFEVVTISSDVIEQLTNHYQRAKSKQNFICNHGDAILSPKNPKIVCTDIAFNVAAKHNSDVISYRQHMAENYRQNCFCLLLTWCAV